MLAVIRSTVTWPQSAEELVNKPEVLSILLLLGLSGTTEAQERNPTPYAVMAPVEQYLIANAQDEIALARSAAPASISRMPKCSCSANTATQLR